MEARTVNTSSTTHTAHLTLANAVRVTVGASVAARTDRDLVPLAEFPAAIMLAVDGDTASAEDIGQAILDLIYAGEAAQRASAATAADLAAVVAEAEAARDAGRDW
jgi:hypothetical protein